MTETEPPIVVGCGADAAFAMPLAVTLFTALERMPADREVEIHVVDGGLTDDSRRRLDRVLERSGRRVRLVTARPDPARFDHLPVAGHLSPATYYRLLLPEAIPGRSRAIYLDGDLLVRADLKGLWDAPMGDRPLMAVREYTAAGVHSPRALANAAELGLDPAEPSLNGGVLLLDLDRWRAEGLADAVLRHTLEYRELNLHGDQDGLNAVLCGRWGELDPRWNVPAYMAEEVLFRHQFDESDFKEHLRAHRQAILRDAFILHYIGSRKPWLPGCALPGQFEWLSALRRCGWFDPGELRPYILQARLTADWIARKALRRIRRMTPAG